MNDLISRQAAIAYAISGRVRTFPTSEDGENWIRTEDVRQSLLSMPSAEPQWIPVSEGLPEKMEPVNITWVNRDPNPYYMNIKDKPFTATGIYFKGQWYWYSVTCEDILEEYGENEIDVVDDGIEITAWKPLPKPYGGDLE